MFRIAPVALAFALVLQAAPARAEIGDTTWVQTWQEDFINWATPHEATFVFPDGSTSWQKVILRYTIACPEAPGDCDPWDRLGYTRLLYDTGEVDNEGNPILDPIEIARIITPYDITGTGRPGSCSWDIDVSDYMHLLQGEVTLSNYIESWIGGERGWLVTLDFGFIEGAPSYRPFKVVNLWSYYYSVYGDPARPIEEKLVPLDVPIDPETDRAKVRIITTGHGQGNTGNCAEFCPKQHTIFADGDSWTHTLWKSNCNANPCSPQGGTWTLSRAGWCPGQDVLPWDLDVTGSVVPGGVVSLDYDVTPYTNYCCPCNPDCVSGVTCADCNYNYNGHTEPHYAIQSQLILFEEVPVTGAPDGAGGTDETARRSLVLENRPNPFRPATTIAYELPAASRAQLLIFDAGGRIVRELFHGEQAAGPHRLAWDGTDEAGRRLPAGAYFYELRIGGRADTRKMMMLE